MHDYIPIYHAQYIFIGGVRITCGNLLCDVCEMQLSLQEFPEVPPHDGVTRRLQFGVKEAHAEKQADKKRKRKAHAAKADAKPKKPRKTRGKAKATQKTGASKKVSGKNAEAEEHDQHDEDAKVEEVEQAEDNVQVENNEQPGGNVQVENNHQPGEDVTAKVEETKQHETDDNMDDGEREQAQVPADTSEAADTKHAQPSAAQTRCKGLKRLRSFNKKTQQNTTDPEEPDKASPPKSEQKQAAKQKAKTQKTDSKKSKKRSTPKKKALSPEEVQDHIVSLKQFDAYVASIQEFTESCITTDCEHHDFDYSKATLGEPFSMDQYWTRESIGLKLPATHVNLDEWNKKPGKSKMVEVAYFSQGGCVMINVKLTQLLANQLHSICVVNQVYGRG